MSRKMYWGLSILIVIFIAGGVFVLVKQQRELAELRQGAAEADKLLEEHQKQQTVADNQPPREARDGFKWEWHGDHWHEMPISENETPHGAKATATPVNFTPPKSDGTSVQARAAASDEVPRYTDLKQMTQDELSKLMDESYAKTNALSDEEDKRWKAWCQAEPGSETAKSLEKAFDSILWEISVYRATAKKAYNVWVWRIGLERSKHPERQLSWVLPEPFDE